MFPRNHSRKDNTWESVSTLKSRNHYHVNGFGSRLYSPRDNANEIKCCGQKKISNITYRGSVKREQQTDFQSGCTTLQSHQQWRSFLLSPHPRKYMLSPEFKIGHSPTGRSSNTTPRHIPRRCSNM